jgi:hypothetical protein
MPRRKGMTDTLLVVHDAPYCGVSAEPPQPCSRSASDSTLVASVVQVFTTLLIVVSCNPSARPMADRE